jgi:hypothetical protein
VGGGLVGHDVDRRSTVEQLRNEYGGVTQQADRQRPARVARLHRELEGVVEVARLHVEVAGLEPPFDPRLVALDADRDPVVHGHRERLRPTHAAEPGGQRDGAGKRAAEPLLGHGGERLEGPLEDALGADVDP